MTDLVILPYTAVAVSIGARIIFIYLLYTKRSTNIYSLIFCYLSVVSSSLWIPYGILIGDIPIIARSSVEILLLGGSAVYITYNRNYHPPVATEPKIIPLDTQS
jgi:uncharacterized protein with PQ loop repeat